MPKFEKRSEILQYIVELSENTTAEMTEITKEFIELARKVEGLGESRELSLAFTHIATALYATIEHLCLVDGQGEFSVIDDN